jgi:hypothetical protein
VLLNNHTIEKTEQISTKGALGRLNIEHIQPIEYYHTQDESGFSILGMNFQSCNQADVLLAFL